MMLGVAFSIVLFPILGAYYSRFWLSVHPLLCNSLLQFEHVDYPNFLGKLKRPASYLLPDNQRLICKLKPLSKIKGWCIIYHR